MFPHFPIRDRAGIEAMQATPEALKHIARTLIAAIGRGLHALRPDLLGATLRSMFS
ncbi:MAG: hypothetical protein IT548_07050 [Alphaproteobacteria bacterium]|nr:hypothetical protein [Alphaproteobacteria bacterium]